ncbi:CDP-glycerol glycerophosphotransferase family protein [Rarobacter faecitabidus]|uniref:CDP-glycerol:poly(Glycerophosphate) glycerophosphotransferase n=1 Tax=Rarobacter faecitabidus TaxID=13243 RepID=A0A542ZU80_RARFA|nr:CDP-glycerol glycerophosphotransferase family protein [Rarobacter faecitabidus]TQL63902.1 CDP-glycerol:poly(glycerophosphate) glycerophosphotransferase [Rarobacter faecitabidus]
MTASAQDRGTVRITPRFVVGSILRRRRSLRRLAHTWSLPVLAFAGAVLIALGSSAGWRIAGVALGLYSAGAFAVGFAATKRRGENKNYYGGYVSLRLGLIAAVSAGFMWQRPGEAGAVAAITIAAVAAVTIEPPLKTWVWKTRQVHTNIPGLPTVPAVPASARRLPLASWLLIAASGVTAAADVTPWVPFALWALLIVAQGALCGWSIVADRISGMLGRGARDAVRELKPEFVVYYAASSGVRYQLGVWLPYLERIGRPFIVITRSPGTVQDIADLTSAPVLCPLDLGAGDLDNLVVPSIRVAYYVQGSPANQTFQRYRNITHVWLNHGDSDKQANFHPRHATYDKLFVAGELAIERYWQNGIDIPREKFTFIGRPQAEKIVDAATQAGAPVRTILYAPTWQGGRPSSSYSSLMVGPEIVKRLLERGLTIVFRPHPLSRKVPRDLKQIQEITALLAADAAKSGRQHVYGAQAETAWDVPDCFNNADALVTDVSSLATDYLASGKPLAMVAVLSGGEEFLSQTPLAHVAYVIEKDLSTLDQVIDDLTGDDPKRPQRLRFRAVCMGESLGIHATEPFIAESLHLIDDPRIANS